MTRLLRWCLVLLVLITPVQTRGADNDRSVIVKTTSRADGRPVGGVVIVDDQGATLGTTNAEGLLTINRPGASWGAIRPVHPGLVFDPPNLLIQGRTDDHARFNFEAAPAESVVPSFAVRFVDGRFKVYRSAATHVDPLLRASLEHLGDGRWRLKLTNGRMPINELWFPWPADPQPLDDEINDDVAIEPTRGGIAKRMTALVEWGWRGTLYPGTSHGPYTIVADHDNARIVAATNWPPIAVTPMISRQRQTLRFDDPIAAGATQTFTVMIAEVAGDASHGQRPWRLALDRYRLWLNGAMAEAGLHPVRYSPFMKSVEGWLAYGLMNHPQYDPAHPRSIWANFGDDFRWMQFWGQMSNYAGDPKLARPPLVDQEKVGCCLPLAATHPRYGDDLPKLADEIRADGGHVGFYCRPRSFDGVYGRLDDPRVINGKTNLRFLTNWIEHHRRTNHANAYYLDVTAAVYLGDPALMIDLLDRQVPDDAVCEFVVDAYPKAFLMSGFFLSTAWPSGPGHSVDGLFDPEAADYDTVLDPRVVRTLIGDRIVFAGGSNTDWKGWGAKNNYWTERQTFLIGAKFDVTMPFETYANQAEMNHALARVLQLRRATRWWLREPVYRDRALVYDVPAGIDVRRFVDRQGVNLFTIDNPAQQKDQRFIFAGREVVIPAEAMSVVEIGPE